MSEELEKQPHFETEGKPVPDISAEGRRKSAAVGEAADVYGSVEEAQEFGYVERGYVLLVYNAASMQY